MRLGDVARVDVDGDPVGVKAALVEPGDVRHTIDHTDWVRSGGS